jgi:hypothetical protein
MKTLHKLVGELWHFLFPKTKRFATFF